MKRDFWRILEEYQTGHRPMLGQDGYMQEREAIRARKEAQDEAHRDFEVNVLNDLLYEVPAMTDEGRNTRA